MTMQVIVCCLKHGVINDIIFFNESEDRLESLWRVYSVSGVSIVCYGVFVTIWVSIQCVCVSFVFINHVV